MADQPENDALDLAAKIKRTAAVPLGREDQHSGIQFNVDMKREGARIWIAALIVACMPLIIFFGFVSLWMGHPTKEILDLASAFLSPVAGIVGAVTGFYFGDKRTRSAE